MKPFGTGAIHTTDSRDYPYAGAAVPEPLPSSYQTPPLPPLMQSHQESCVSHAWVRALQFYWWKKTGKVIDFSPRFLHAYTAPGMADDDGRDPRVVANALVKVGCCTTALLPNDVNLSTHDYSFVPITQAMLDEAAQYKIPAYSFVSADSYSIRHAIYHKGAVVLLFHIGNEWWTPDYLPEHINPLRPPQVTVGGHEVTGEHWNTIEGIQNSWGEWDERGYGEYDLSNYKPLQVICIDDPFVDFNSVTPYVFTRNLGVESFGQDVIELQKRLGVSPTFWVFGPKTRLAVVSYQQAHNLPATGYCGPLTRASLNT